MKETDLAYAAGIIDGEGCIAIAHCKHAKVTSGYVNRLSVAVAMTTPEIPQWFKDNFGGCLSKKKSSYSNHRDVHTWMIQATQAQVYLKMILPYLKLKQPQAKNGILFQAVKSSGGYRSQNPKPKEAYEVEEFFVGAMHLLNRRGKDTNEMPTL